MRKSKKWMAMALALALTVLCAGAALAAGGDENDPLVTLSYLEETVLPHILGRVEDSADKRQAELEKDFSAQISQYKKEAAELAQTTGDGESASYALITLNAGQTMYLDVGCELMLRVGTVKVNAATSPALIDIATGASVNNGASLTKNHLYMATIPDRTLTPTAATVKLLVRGGYTVV